MKAKDNSSEEKYRTLFDESRDAIYITSREGQFLDANPALLELFGYDKEELIGNTNVRQLYSNPEDRERFQQQIEKQGSVRNYEVKFRRKDGTVMDCLLTATVRGSTDGKILGYQGIIRDVSEQKRAEEALRESEEHYRAIVEAFDGLVYVCSRNYRVEFMNQSLIKRTGHDATGDLCYRALHDLDSICPWCVNERVFAGETVRWEILSPKDNRWYYVVNTPIYHTDGTVSKQAMILDITERKRMEEELRESSDKIKLFAYSVSHDLKSPAISIYGLTNRLQQRFGDALGERGKHYCGQIAIAAEQIAKLVEQINVYIATKEAPLSIGSVSLKELLGMVQKEFSAQLSVRQIRWREPKSIPDIKADRLSILRILRNLVDNALKYGGDGLSEIKMGYRETEKHHIVSVKDDGVGMNQEDSKTIFGPFVRRKTSKGIQGTGLGLATVKEIAERHNGQVWAKPGPGKGITFFISISKHLKQSC